MRQRAPERDGEARLGMLSSREEQRVPLEGIARGELDAGEVAVVVLEPRHRLGAQRDAIVGEPLSCARIEPRPLAAHDDVAAPRAQTEREARDIPALAERGEPAIADFPAVAVRTVKHRPAITLAETINDRQIVDDAGGDEEIPRLFFAAVAERHTEAFADFARA